MNTFTHLRLSKKMQTKEIIIMGGFTCGTKKCSKEVKWLSNHFLSLYSFSFPFVANQAHHQPTFAFYFVWRAVKSYQTASHLTPHPNFYLMKLWPEPPSPGALWAGTPCSAPAQAGQCLLSSSWSYLDQLWYLMVGEKGMDIFYQESYFILSV